jgi:hypothetical protein
MTSIVEWVKAALARLIHPRTGRTRPGHTGTSPSGETAASGPVKHLGATETFGAELRALRAAEVSPELVSDIEVEMQWGQTWFEFERTMQSAIDRTFEPYLPVPEVHNFDELREQVGLHEEKPERAGPEERRVDDPGSRDGSDGCARSI